MFLKRLGFVVALACAFATPALADTAGYVHGMVQNDGRPLSHALVFLRGDKTFRRTQTDQYGRFSFSDVTFGTYHATVDLNNKHADALVNIQSDGIVELVLALGTLPVIGHVDTGVSKGAASAPISVTTISKATIAASPYSENLSRLIETVPGIVRFSYDEPVAHGFHGVTYELDGNPLPQSTASNFSEIIDPRTIDSLEVLTGAFPAEYGGERQGAVVNIVSDRFDDKAPLTGGSLTVGMGTYGSAETRLTDHFTIGSNTQAVINVNENRTNRGIDSPTFEPLHDAASDSDEFFRTLTKMNNRETLAVDMSSGYAAYQVPINVTAASNDSQVSPVGTDDVQREYQQLFSVTYKKLALDGKGYTQISPWYRYDRVRYDGDETNDLASTLGTSLFQDRHSLFTGLRAVHFQVIGNHAIKTGVDGSIENFQGNENIDYLNTNQALSTFADSSAQRGTKFGTYIQDKWTPTRYVSILGGLRYDRSTGYIDGSQLSPRFEMNGQVGTKDVVHGYVGRFYAAPYLEDTRRAATVLSGGDASDQPMYDLKPEQSSYDEIGLAHTMNPQSRWYFNAWKRDVVNVLDTTQLANTPIFAVYNSAIGIAKGLEARIEARSERGDSASLSATVSQSEAGGISGGTFLVCPAGSDPTCASDNTLQPEDHDQTVTVNATLTKRLGHDGSYFASISPQYGTGYPIAFLDGSQGRLPPHLTFDLAFGREAGESNDHRMGYLATIENLFNRDYLIKVDNGFNSTQYAQGFKASLRVTEKF